MPAKPPAFAKAIVVGASSGIGEQIARQLGQSGTTVALIARREETLQRIAAEIGANARIYSHDVTDYTAVPALFQKICRDLDGLDLLVYASGVMPSVAVDEFAFDKDRAMLEVNLLGLVAWLNQAAHRFQVARVGTIVGISSVAGDRGRQGMPVYAATKSATDTYLEALRNRLAVKGVRVVTVKPGPVRTPMTAALGKLPLMIDADVAAAQILKAAERGSRTAYIPGIWRPIMWTIRHIPAFIFERVNI